MVEALITHEAPIQTPWTVTKYITSAHEEVVWHQGKLPRINERVNELVSRPKIRDSEYKACVLILAATKPEMIVDTVDGIMKVYLYIFIYIYIYACMLIHAYAHTCICVYIHEYTHTYISSYIRTYAYAL